ncbi:MAG: hypothetical protein ACXVXB_12550 [Nocardioidaceae bacterium]
MRRDPIGTADRPGQIPAVSSPLRLTGRATGPDTALPGGRPA